MSQPDSIIARRRLRNWLIGTILVAVVGWLDFNLGMLATLLAIPIGLVRVFSALFGKQDLVGGPAWRLSGVVVGVFCVAVGPASCSMKTALLNRDFEPTIAALEAFRNDHGGYPNKLEEMVPQYINETASCPFPEWQQALYLSDENRSRFRITCMTFGFNHHTYDSSTREWTDWD